ncbi:PaaI family thioesterase [Aspergillus affinis]|uniref:PaaI family thioesterase n=1 Tax=Aspergillus affinis TaxID=1070780 RepID=UPI0022FF1C08|nr:thioesterase family protein [Aspergillus affinis]KAI9041040.1 thioesterase family protein [Aspergillus affinis]
MSSPRTRAPARELDDFEQSVYEYSNRISWDDDQEHWDLDPSSNIRFESATRGPPARVSFLFTVSPKLCNLIGNLHGGCAATLIDVLSTCILLGVSSPGHFGLGGVSRHLKVTYLRPVPQGTDARLVCEIVHVGRRLAFMKAEISRADTGALCIVGEHEKANTDPEAGGKI